MDPIRYNQAIAANNQRQAEEQVNMMMNNHAQKKVADFNDISQKVHTDENARLKQQALSQYGVKK